MYLVDYHTHSCCSFDSEESLLDEAGQATPQSAAGALWRARRAAVIGDPQRQYSSGVLRQRNFNKPCAGRN